MCDAKWDHLSLLASFSCWEVEVALNSALSSTLFSLGRPSPFECSIGPGLVEKIFPYRSTYLLRRYKSLDPQSLHKYSIFELAYLRRSADP